MKKTNVILVALVILIALISVSFALENDSYEMSIYVGDRVNLKNYIQTEQKNFEWQKDTVVQNLNASVLSINSLYFVDAKEVGYGILVISNGEDSITVHVKVESPIEGVTLKSNYLSLMLGEIYDIEYFVKTKDNVSINNNYGIFWTSTRPKIATVSNNSTIITASVGTTKIVAKAVDGTVVAELELTVIGHSDNVRITSENSIRTLNVGEQFKLTAYFGTKDITENIEWESLTPHVINVNKHGVIEAIGEGRGVIKAQSSVSNKYATYEVNAYSMIDHIDLNHTAINFKGVGQTQQLYFSLYPKDKSYPPLLSGYRYITSNPDVAIVSESGLITSKGSGIALISVIFEDSQKRASCTVEVVSDALLDGTSYTPVESIELKADVETALIGDKIPLNIKVLPENASLKDMIFNIPYGSNTQIHQINGNYYFIPEKRGNIRIEVNADGISDAIVIPVTSPIDSMDLSLSTRRVTGTNEEQLYIGEKAKLFTKINTKKGYDKSSVYLSSLKYYVENENIAELMLEDNCYYVKGLKKGKTKITVENLEGLHETTLWVDVVDPILSISTDDQVVLPFSMSYRPRVNTTFIGLSKPVSNAFNIYDMITLKADKLYLYEEFIDKEIEYEENTIVSYGKPPYDLKIRDDLESHQTRLYQLKRYKSAVNDRYALLEDEYTLKDRNGNLYKFYAINDNQVSSAYPIKIELNIAVDHTNHTTKTMVVFNDDDTQYSIMRLGQLYNVQSLINQYGLDSILGECEVEEQIELLITYLNNMELFNRQTTYSVLKSLFKINKSDLTLPSYADLDELVSKSDLVKLSVTLHKKYINRFLDFSDSSEIYYYDVVDPDTKNAISLGYLNPTSEGYFGAGETVTIQDYYMMLKHIIPSYQDFQYNSKVNLTFETLIVELGKLIK